MDSPGRHAASTAPIQKWLPFGIIGLVAIAAGVLLPQLMTNMGAPAPRQAEARPSPVAKVPEESKGSDAKGPGAKPAGDTAKAWNYTPPAWPEAPSHQGMFLRLGIGTALVLLLCTGTIFACKRWLRGDPAPAALPSQLKLVETLPLGRRCWVQLVHVGTQAVLVGGDPTGLKTIVPLPESFASALLAAPAEPASTDLASVLARRFTATMDARPDEERG